MILRSPRGRLALLLLLGIFAPLLASKAAPPPAKVDYTGHYELSDISADRTFSLDITQAGSRAQISFSASMVDGSGAAPDGDGAGKIDSAGILKFKFTDSFGNAGTGTLRRAVDGYEIDLDAATVAEPRALRFYGHSLLKKTADQPSA